MTYAAGEIESLADPPAIMIGGQVVWIDHGWVADIGTRESDPTAAGGVGHAGQNGVSGACLGPVEALGDRGGDHAGEHHIRRAVGAGQVAAVNIGQGLRVLQT